MSAYPSVLSEIAGRTVARSRELALRTAIMQVRGVEVRIQLLFWRLADRWGRVVPAGYVVPLNPEQATIGELVGATRSRVNTALGELDRSGCRTILCRSLTAGSPEPVPAGRGG